MSRRTKARLESENGELRAQLARLQAERSEPRPAEMHDAGDRIVMDISIEEAMTLELIACRVSGCPNKSPRKHTDSLLRALNDLGFTHDYRESHKVMADKTPGFHFKDGNIRLVGKRSSK